MVHDPSVGFSPCQVHTVDPTRVLDLAQGRCLCHWAHTMRRVPEVFKIGDCYEQTPVQYIPHIAASKVSQ